MDSSSFDSITLDGFENENKRRQSTQHGRILLANLVRVTKGGMVDFQALRKSSELLTGSSYRARPYAGQKSLIFSIE